MTNDLGPIYTSQTKENFSSLWADWEPGNPMMVSAMQDTDDFQTEDSEEEIYFGQFA